MQADYLAALQSLPVRDRSQLEVALLKVLTGLSESDPQPVRAIKTHFSAFNNRAKQGHALLVKSDPGEETVLLSVKDLATMIQSAAKSVSLDDALDASGFRAAEGRLEPLPGQARGTLLAIR